MIIGVMSDSHDNMPQIRKAVDFFNARSVEHVIHAGDFGAPFTFRILKDLKCGFTGIYGNNDGEKLLLQKLSQGRIFKQPHIFELDGKKFVLVHEHHVVDALAASGHYDVVVCGHTHEADVRMIGKTLVVNPGETGGWLYGKSTVAIVDLATMATEIVDLNN